MSYSFVPPPKNPERLYTVPMVGAIMLFREATGAGIGDSKHFIEFNLRSEVNQEYNVKDIGRLINAYFKQHPYIKVD